MDDLRPNKSQPVRSSQRRITLFSSPLSAVSIAKMFSCLSALGEINYTAAREAYSLVFSAWISHSILATFMYIMSM